MTEPPQDITLLLEKLETGDPEAAALLLPQVYEELRRLAKRFLRGERPGHTLQPTALVHEVYLNLVKRPDAEWKGQRHFMAVAARAMRNILINHAKAHRAEKRGGGMARVTLIDHDPENKGTPCEFDLLALDDALSDLAKLTERGAKIVELRFFGGLTVPETAEILKVSPRTVKDDWQMARAWLFRALHEKG